MNEVSIAFAFTAGLLSFFSPCIFPLLPVYVANLTGALIENNKIKVSRRLLLIRSLGFIGGFSLVFIIMGASASLLGEFVVEHRNVIERIGGAIIIVFGLQLAGILKLKFLNYEKQWSFRHERRKSLLSSFLLGISFGAGWTPCVGLALSSILLLAGGVGTIYQGVFLLFVYSLGLGLPFLVISFVVTYSLSVVQRMNRLLDKITLLSGAVLVLMGLLLVTGHFSEVSAWFVNFTNE